MSKIQNNWHKYCISVKFLYCFTVVWDSKNLFSKILQANSSYRRIECYSNHQRRKNREAYIDYCILQLYARHSFKVLCKKFESVWKLPADERIKTNNILGEINWKRMEEYCATFQKCSESWEMYYSIKSRSLKQLSSWWNYQEKGRVVLWSMTTLFSWPA